MDNKQNQKLNATVSQARVSSVKDINLTTNYGMVPSLPGSVYATLDDGRKIYVDIIWNSSAKTSETYKTGQDSILVYGMTKSYGNFPVTATIRIKQIISVDFEPHSVAYSHIPVLPSAIITTSFGGAKSVVTVSWEAAAKVTSTYTTYAGAVTINGVIPSYGNYPVQTTITVLTIASLEDVTMSTKYGDVPVFPNAHGLLSNGDKTSLPIVWEPNAKIEATYETNADSIQIKGRINGYDTRDITATVKIINIASLENINFSVKYGVVPEVLPSAHAILTDGKNSVISVKWESAAKIATTYMTSGSTVEIRGNLLDFDKREVTATVNIINVASIEPIVLSTPRGVLPALPGSVNVLLNNGENTSTFLSWNDEARDKNTYYTDADTITVYGALSRYDKRQVTATIKILKVTSMKEINLNTNYGSVPFSMPGIVRITLSDASTRDAVIDWSDEAKSAETYKTTASTITVTGNLVSYGQLPVKATVNVINVVSIEDISISTKYGKLPLFPDAHAALNNGKNDVVDVIWDEAAKNEDTYKTTSQTVVINGTLAKYDKRAVTARVTVINVSQIDNITGETIYGKALESLPSAHVTLTDGKNEFVGVVWENAAKVSQTYVTNNPTVSINGTLASYDKRGVTGTISVLNVSSMPAINRFTPNGIVPSLPWFVPGVLNNGETKSIYIKWDDRAKSADTYRTSESTVIVNGNLESYDKRSVEATVNILAVSGIEDINLTTRYGVVPSLPSTVKITLSDGTTRKPEVVWDDAAKNETTYMTGASTIKINGSLVNYGELPITANVTIINVVSVNEITGVTNYGEVPDNMPSANVNLTNGNVQTLSVIWEDAAKLPETYATNAPTVSIRGNLTWYDKRPVTANITVLNVRSIPEIIKSTPNGIVPSLPGCVSGVLTNGETKDIYILWEDSVKAQETYKTNAESVIVNGNLKYYDKRKVTAKVNILKVTQMDDINLTTNYGIKPSLPDSIAVTLSDGTNKKPAIVWEDSASLPETYMTKEASIKINGKLVNYGELPVSATVNVINVSDVEEINYTTLYGEVPNISNAYVTLNNGVKKYVPIAWNDQAKAVETYKTSEHTVVIHGNLTNYDKREITATITIVPDVTLLEPIKATTEYGEVPELPDSVSVSLSTGETVNAKIIWKQTAKDPATYRTNQGTVTAYGYLPDYADRVVMAVVTISTISSISDVKLTTDYGKVPEFPATVQVTFSDGTNSDVSVNWEKAASLASTYTVSSDTVTINGTTAGYGNKAVKGIVTIKTGVISIDPIKLTTNYGVVPMLPDNASVTLNNGRKAADKIIWNQAAKASVTYETEEQTVNISGTLADYGNETVTAIVTVKPKVNSVGNINVSTINKTKPTLPNTVSVTLSDGTTVQTKVIWEAAASADSTYNTGAAAVTINGTLPDYGNMPITAVVKVTPSVDVVNAGALSTISNTVPALPSTINITLSNGTTTNAKVVWDPSASSAATYNTTAGTVTIIGTLPDYNNQQVTVTVSVKPRVISVNPINLTTRYGIAPTLPAYAVVNLSNGTTQNAEITWSQAASLGDTYKTKAASVIIGGNLAAYDNKAITATVTIIPVFISVDSINLSTDYGVVPALPSTAGVNLSDGTKSSSSITWTETAAAASTYETKEAAVVVFGTLPAYDGAIVRATVTINPKPISVEPINLTTVYGVVPKLPSTASVKFTNGTTQPAAVVWGEAASSPAIYETKEPSVMVYGVLPSYSNMPVTAIVTIIPKLMSVSPINLTTNYGVVPALPSTAVVSLSNGTSQPAAITWSQAAKAATTYETKEATVAIYGTLAAYNNEPVTGIVTIIPKLLSLDPISLTTDYGVVPALPDTVNVNFSNGTKGTASAIWNDTAKAAATYKTKDKTVAINGNLKDYDNMSITGIVAINPPKENLKEQIHYGEEGVHPATGNLARNYTDMIINQASPNMNVTRTYNGKDKRENRPFGRGWTFGFEGSVSDYSDTVPIKIVRLPNGSIATFIPNEDGSFTANDSRNTLVQKEDGSYVVTAKDQNSFGFNADGYLCWIKDRYGNVTNIAVDREGKVTAVKDPVGRSLTVAYNNGLITSIADGMGRTVTYGYTNNLLTSAKGPAGKVTNYKYNEQRF